MVKKKKNQIKSKAEKKRKKVTLTMEGNLKGPLDGTHVQPGLKCFTYPVR